MTDLYKFQRAHRADCYRNLADEALEKFMTATDPPVKEAYRVLALHWKGLAGALAEPSGLLD